MSQELPKAYDPHAVEERIYEEWERSGAFAPRGDGEPFCIVLPPPNVTGILHMGHALDHSVQPTARLGVRVAVQQGKSSAVALPIAKGLRAAGSSRSRPSENWLAQFSAHGQRLGKGSRVHA